MIPNSLIGELNYGRKNMQVTLYPYLGLLSSD